MSEAFCGVPAEFLDAIGRVAVAAARVEAEAQSISLTLGTDARSLQFKTTAKTIRTLVGAGLPSHARVAPEAILAWVDRAMSLMDHRNQLMHSFISIQMRPDSFARVRTHIRNPHQAHDRLASHAEISKLAEDLRAVSLRGTRLSHDLMIEPREGVYLRPISVPGASWVICGQLADGSWPERPTDDEADEWWRLYAPELVRDEAGARFELNGEVVRAQGNRFVRMPLTRTRTTS
ncbi:MAG TPA: hypothetical protein VGG07_25875 [Solirubrobacteraceae bacterium]|jgi:hypothetical protein